MPPSPHPPQNVCVFCPTLTPNALHFLEQLSNELLFLTAQTRFSLKCKTILYSWYIIRIDVSLSGANLPKLLHDYYYRK